MDRQGKWAGRDSNKDVLRNDVWGRLEDSGMSLGPVWSHIPNFIGADQAAWHLAQTDAWKQAKTVKCNPDPPQIPVRLRALYDGKVLYAPVPYLTREFPYLRIDPRKLSDKGVSFELAATSEGYMLHGERVEFDQVEPLDFCVRRLGRGKPRGWTDRQGSRLCRSRDGHFPRTRRDHGPDADGDDRPLLAARRQFARVHDEA